MGVAERPGKFTVTPAANWAFVTLRVLAMAAMVFVAAPANATSVDDVIPGSSYTKYAPNLAIQSWEIATMSAHIQEPRTCQTAKLTDTKVIEVQQQVIFDSRKRLKQGRWSEVWTFDKCGRKVRVRADFKADGRGFADGEFNPM